MKLTMKLWVVGLSVAGVAIWGGVNYFREQARLKREAQLQAERAAREEARAKAYIELRTPDEIAAANARAAADKAKREAQDRAEAQFKATQAAQAKIDEAKRERAMKNALAGAITLKRAMKDPEAFVLRSATMHENGATCYQYRAKNSFGAVLPGRALFHSSGNFYLEESDRDSFWLLWKAQCELSAGREVSDELKRSGAI
jgi:hypothetical protein